MARDPDPGKTCFEDLPQELRDIVYEYAFPCKLTVTVQKWEKCFKHTRKYNNDIVVMDVVNWQEFKIGHNLFATSKQVRREAIKYCTDKVPLEVDCSWQFNKNAAEPRVGFERPSHYLPFSFIREKESITIVKNHVIELEQLQNDPCVLRIEVLLKKITGVQTTTAGKSVSAFRMVSHQWFAAFETRRSSDAFRHVAMQHVKTSMKSFLALRFNHVFPSARPGVPFNAAHHIKLHFMDISGKLLWNLQQAMAFDILGADIWLSYVPEANGIPRQGKWRHCSNMLLLRNTREYLRQFFETYGGWRGNIYYAPLYGLLEVDIDDPSSF